MQKINELLARFSHLTIPGETVRKETQRIIEEVTGVAIELMDISCKRGGVFVHTTPATKQKIFLKQKIILQRLSETLPQKAPGTIKFK